ncbi:MAG: hypothetical protein ACRDZV_00100 [Acidimicrobiia bacterium]
METLAYLAPVLGCAGMMAAMVWMMSSGQRKQAPPAANPQDEIEALREEIAGLREGATGEPASDG